jgi:hypothetical protein
MGRPLRRPREGVQVAPGGLRFMPTVHRQSAFPIPRVGIVGVFRMVGYVMGRIVSTQLVQFRSSRSRS